MGTTTARTVGASTTTVMEISRWSGCAVIGAYHIGIELAFGIFIFVVFLVASCFTLLFLFGFQILLKRPDSIPPQCLYRTHAKRSFGIRHGKGSVGEEHKRHIADTFASLDLLCIDRNMYLYLCIVMLAYVSRAVRD